MNDEDGTHIPGKGSPDQHGVPGHPVSLKERMEATRISTGSNVIRVHLLWVVSTCILLLLVAAISGWHFCVLDQKEISKLPNSTATIINKITDNKGSGPKEVGMEWYLDQVKGWHLGVYLAFSPATKREVQVAIAKLGTLQKVSDANELAEKISAENQQAPPGLWGKIVGKISKAKVEADRIASEEEAKRKKTEAERLAKEEKQREAKLAEQEKQKREEANKLAEEKRQKEAALKEWARKNGAPVVSTIRFKQLKEGEDPIGELFPGNQLPVNAVGWYVANVSGNPLLATNGWETITNWFSNPPSANMPLGLISTRGFKEFIINSACPAFATKDKSNNVAVTILYKQGKSWTNAGGAFTAELNGDAIKITVMPEPAGFIPLITNSAIKYEIIVSNKVCELNGKPLSSSSPEELGKMIVDEIKRVLQALNSREELTVIQQLLADLKSPNPKTYKSRIEILDGANPVLIFTCP